MSILIGEMDLTELALYIYAVLKKHKITAVLTGGAVVSIYTENKYQSNDLDFITAADQEKIIYAMKTIGFTKKGKDFYNSESQFTVEFPTGPLAVGDEYLGDQEEVKIRGRAIKLLTPTNSIKDRLAGYYYYNDNQNLKQAIQIFIDVGGKLNEIERWSKNEGQDSKFKIFTLGIKEKQKKSPSVKKIRRKQTRL